MTHSPALNHTCHLYSTWGEQKAVWLPFVGDGLRAGEPCLLITRDELVDDWLFELQAFGVDVRASLDDRALVVVPASDWLAGGAFNSILQARRLLDLIEHSPRSYRGLRLLNDVAWARSTGLPAADLCHWEATLDLIADGQPLNVMCQYGIEDETSSAIQAALRTHSRGIRGSTAYSSPFYEAPRILANEPLLNDCSADATRVDAMLGVLGDPAYERLRR